MVDASLRRFAPALAIWLVGCAGSSDALRGASASSPEPPASVPPDSAQQASQPRDGALQGSSAAPADAFHSGFRIIEAVGQGVVFPLPDASGWRHDRREAQSWVARHRVTASTLIVRAWRHDDVARPEDCERQARLWRPSLPEPQPFEIMEERSQRFGDAYTGRATLFVRSGAAGGQGQRLAGHALGFGSDARDCVMLSFSTAASGPGAESAIARRLGAIVRSVFERVRRVGIGERVLVPRM